MLLMASFAAAVYPPDASSGCPTDGCNAFRTGNGVMLAKLPMSSAPKSMWSYKYPVVPQRGTLNCGSGGGSTVVCTSNGATISFNTSGLAWRHGPQSGHADGSSVFLANGLQSQLAGVVEGDTTLVIRSTKLGGAAMTSTLGAGTLGPWVLPRDGTGDDSSLVLVMSSGRRQLTGWNVELGLCWSSGFMCASTASTACGPQSTDVLTPLGAPVVPANGGTAYFTAADSDGRVYVVRVDVGSMVSRLPASTLGHLDGTALPGQGSAPLLLAAPNTTMGADSASVLLIRTSTALYAVIDARGPGRALRVLWKRPMVGSSQEGHAVGLAADPRGGVWVSAGDPSAGVLQRLSTVDGRLIEHLGTLAHVGLGSAVSRPLLLCAGTGRVDCAMLAVFSAQGGGCALAAFELAQHSPTNTSVRWRWPEAGSSEPPLECSSTLQIGLLERHPTLPPMLIVGRARDVVALSW